MSSKMASEADKTSGLIALAVGVFVALWTMFLAIALLAALLAEEK